MARVAVVTGGTRGIGAAVSKALVAAGCNVAATYHGNDEAAAKFKAETGVQVYKWDVGNYEACVAGLAQVAKDLGPVEILVVSTGGPPAFAGPLEPTIDDFRSAYESLMLGSARSSRPHCPG